MAEKTRVAAKKPETTQARSISQTAKVPKQHVRLPQARLPTTSGTSSARWESGRAAHAAFRRG